MGGLTHNPCDLGTLKFNDVRLVAPGQSAMAGLVTYWRLPMKVIALAACLCLTAHIKASWGSPENMLLVINSADDTSIEIGELYQRLRHIPDQNVFRLNWKGGRYTIKIQEFRNDLLGVILSEIRRRGLERQISYVTYSTGFPFAVDFAEEVPAGQGAVAKGSTTGLTYLHELTMSKTTAFAAPATNGYYQAVFPRHLPLSHDFPTPAEQAAGKQLTSSGLSKYFLSVMLGFTGGLGNTKEEIQAYLQASALADGSRPKGSVYFMRNSDIRSSTRHDAFAEVVDELQRLGVTAREENGILPRDRTDVAGLVVGTSNFNWKESRSRIVPGAICEHLTSFGGLMATGNHQTPLTEFLRYGAAGSSGTVEEPGAVLAKFPHPVIQVHYARGCNLAAAFYQSVASPYQLLIVGDPLCRPWGSVPMVSASVATVNSSDSLHEVRIQVGKDVPVEYLELFIDGKSMGMKVPDAVRLRFPLELPPGRHEIRVVAVSKDFLRSRGRAIVRLDVPNPEPPKSITN